MMRGKHCTIVSRCSAAHSLATRSARAWRAGDSLTAGKPGACCAFWRARGMMQSLLYKYCKETFTVAILTDSSSICPFLSSHKWTLSTNLKSKRARVSVGVNHMARDDEKLSTVQDLIK